MNNNLVHIDLGERSYDIHIDAGLLGALDKVLPFDIAGKKIFIVTDVNVEPYAQQVKSELVAAGAGFCDVLVHPFGEKTKSYDCLMKTHSWMLENNIHRNSIVFAIGGGVIGDLAGFCASSILRGVPYVQIPTTLLSQVDSSVGGKTGINTEFGKNLVGAFYQPVSVVADISTLNTLPKRELLAGYAEVAKYGLIWDLPFFEWLEENASRVIDLDAEAISYAIKVSCEAKAAVVQADEREGGKRALLNLGHTFGHALEAAAGYNGSLLHGEGVSIGMVMAFDLSAKMGLCSVEDAKRARDHLRGIGLPVHAGEINAEIDDLIATMKRDKKALDNKMTFILVKGIGEAFITQDVEESLVRDILKASLAEEG
ncbi:MAG: 3-dehydroquinate synthase [Alphaproteobacteria bacterium]